MTYTTSDHHILPWLARLIGQINQFWGQFCPKMPRKQSLQGIFFTAPGSRQVAERVLWEARALRSTHNFDRMSSPGR